MFAYVCVCVCVCAFWQCFIKDFEFWEVIKDYISSRVRSSSKDALLAFSTFDPKKVPKLSSELSL